VDLAFRLVIPEDCRVCGVALREASRAPVCPSCLKVPAPFVAEFFCVSCHSPFLNRFPLDDEGRCGLCRRGLRHFDTAYSFGLYEGNLRKLIHLYKYGKVRTLAPALARMMASALPLDEQIDLVVAMPLHWRKRWQRGFNQSELLAREIARRYGAKPAAVLSRKRATKAQAGLNHTRRRENVAGAFAVPSPNKVRGRSVLLIDDVFTTGATVSACAAALRQAGATRVVVLTLARVDRRMGSTSLSGELVTETRV
jgi:ComF family protein